MNAPAPTHASTSGWRQWLLSHFPPGQFSRYLCVGAFNTAFGYSTFVLINLLLHRHGVPASYIFAFILSNFINITVAYFGYKLFVFKTKGNYMKEWLKAMAVYWSSLPIGITLLPLCVYLLHHLLPQQMRAAGHVFSNKEAAPYIANAILLGVGVIYSFLGHKHVTFRQKPTA